MLDPQALRSQTSTRLHDAGFPDVPGHLPIVWEADEGYSVRPLDEIVLRLAALDVGVAVSFGMPRDVAQRWVNENGVESALSDQERLLLSGDERVNVDAKQAEVEAIWGLLWVVSLGRSLDPAEYCPDDLVRRVPDLKASESLTSWRARMTPTLRAADEVMAELDLHYCMTWCLAEANLKGQRPPGRIQQSAIWQRRRALEFVLDSSLAHADWDHIDLST
jgi:hypothetical protein